VKSEVQLRRIYLPRMWVNKPRRTTCPESLINLGQQIAQYVSCQEILKERTIWLRYKVI
jgi:hypothetical protein